MSKLIGQEFYALFAMETTHSELSKSNPYVQECIVISNTEKALYGVENGLYVDINTDSIMDLLHSLNISSRTCGLYTVGKVTALLAMFGSYMKVRNSDKIVLIPKNMDVRKFSVDGRLIEAECLFKKSIYTIEEKGSKDSILDDIAEIIFLLNESSDHIMSRFDEIDNIVKSDMKYKDHIKSKLDYIDTDKIVNIAIGEYKEKARELMKRLEEIMKY